MKYFFNYNGCQLNLKFAYVLDDHDQEGEFDGQGLSGIDGAANVVGGYVSSHDLNNRGLNIRVSYSLDVTVSDVFGPNLEGLGTIQ